MKVLTIRNPWAKLIARREKTVELRTWRVKYRGPLLIHAGTGTDREPIDIQTDDIPKGMALCVVDLLDIVPATPADMRAAWCPEEPPGKWLAWRLRYLYAVDRFPLVGKLGLWNLDDRRVWRVPPPNSESTARVMSMPSLWKGRPLATVA